MSYGLIVTREVKNGLKKAIEKVEKLGWIVTIILEDQIPKSKQYPLRFEEFLKEFENFIQEKVNIKYDQVLVDERIRRSVYNFLFTEAGIKDEDFKTFNPYEYDLMEYKKCHICGKVDVPEDPDGGYMACKSCHERIEREIESIEPDYYARICQ